MGCTDLVLFILVLLLFMGCGCECECDAAFKNYDEALLINNSENKDSWQVLLNNSGISAMHMTLMRNGKVIMLDRAESGPSNISLPNGRCRLDPNDLALKNDCWAHSVEYDIGMNKVRALMIKTDTWCSAGAMDKDGRLIQTGGYNDGERVVRMLDACQGCDWVEFPGGLRVRRWYSTDAILPDGRVIVIGGRLQFNYEFIPGNSTEAIDFPFLNETRDASENNLYPFVHLLPDGNLFIFANTRSVLFNYNNNTILHEYPPMPGGFARNYPSSGSSVLLPLDGDREASVLICGGARADAYSQANKGIFLAAATSCGRLSLMDPDAEWLMEEMPFPRVMGDMLLLPTGDVLLINGAKKGTGGWFRGRDPVFHPILYRPGLDPPNRFVTLAPSTIPRMYHSSCHLLPDGRVLVGGSNPNIFYNFVDVLFPTELSLEAFSPPYLAPALTSLRPIVTLWGDDVMVYGANFVLEFYVEELIPMNEGDIRVSLMAPAFTTHSYSMNQRLLWLRIAEFVILPLSYQLSILTPSSTTLAPPGYYLLYVVYYGIPSTGKWVQLQG